MSEALANPTSDVTGVNRYIQFVHDASKKTKQPFLDAGGKLPGFMLVGGGMTLPLPSGNKIELGIIASTKLLTRKDNKGKIAKGYRVKDFPGAVTKDKYGNPVYKIDGEPKDYDEHYFVLGILRGQGSPCPVTLNFYAASSTRGIANAHSNLIHAQDAEKWGKMPGPGFAVSAKATGAAGRFIAKSTLEVKVSPTSGNTYVTGRCDVRPTTEAEVVEYNALAEDPQFIADVLTCQASWERSIKVACGEVKDEETTETEV